jgi:DNA-binding MarR family transcriptional regulator
MAATQSRSAVKAEGRAVRQERRAKQPESAFESNLSYRLSILNALLGKATAEIYNAEQLTTHQWKVMSVICNFAPIPASEVMRWVTLDKSAISRAVRKLHTQGLIERKLSDSDARISHIMPTRKGRDMNKRLVEKIATLQTGLLSSITDTRVRAMFEAFDQLEGQLRERFSPTEEE